MLANLISRTRRNHGLEHATIHMLSQRQSNFSAQGNSNHRGFYLNIFGNVPETTVRDAVYEAYNRMKKGEHHLAVHPNCGTVLLTTATLSALAAQAAFSIELRRQHQKAMTIRALLNGLPTAVLAVVVMLIVSRPLGLQLQANFTTEGDLGAMEIVSVSRIEPSPITRLFHLLLGQSLPATAYRIDTRN